MTDSNVVQTAQVLSERYGPAYRWLVTIAGMVGVVSMVLAMTTVNVAVPDVMGAFGIGQDQAQWMSSAYMATMTAGMLINAWLTGILGERRVFVGSLFFFSLGALMGGMAPTEHWLILSRVLQGFSAGVAQPLVMATIFTVFPPDRRGMAMGVFGLGVVFAPAIGPTLGGLMIEYFSWRYVFFISLPFCVIAAGMGLLFMPTRRIPREIPPFDWLGFALLCISLFGLMTGIADGQREGWSSDTIVLRLDDRRPGRPRLHPVGAAHAARAARRAHLRQHRVLGRRHDRLHLRRRHDGLDLRHPGVRADHHRLHAAAGRADDDAGRHHARLHLPGGRTAERRHAGLGHDHRRPAAVRGWASPG